jgi:hypothetical protein
MATSLTYVEVPANPEEDPADEDTTEWRKVFDKKELERILFERNQQHFAQDATDETPIQWTHYTHYSTSVLTLPSVKTLDLVR